MARGKRLVRIKIAGERQSNVLLSIDRLPKTIGTDGYLTHHTALSPFDWIRHRQYVNTRFLIRR